MTPLTPPLSNRLLTVILTALLASPIVSQANNAAPMITASANPTSAPATTYYSTDPAKWGTPLMWKAPDYPKAMVEQKVTGTVDVMVAVAPDGKFADIAALRSTPAQPAFEEAVRDAIKHWTFTKAMDAECKPAATRGQLQVRFELMDGKPQVNVGAISADKGAGRMVIQELNRREVNQALSDNYPVDARRLRQSGEVLARLKVDARSGEIRDVDITEVFASTASNNPERSMTPWGQEARLHGRSSPAAIQFASVARDQLAALRFKPVTDSATDQITVCREVAFQMQGVRRE